MRSNTQALISAIGILAEDIGGSLALLLAAEDPGVWCLAWLQPGLQYRKLNVRRAAGALGERPALYMTTTPDGYARHSARALSALSSRGDVRVLDASPAHGADALRDHPEIADRLGKWLADTLKSAPARR